MIYTHIKNATVVKIVAFFVVLCAIVIPKLCPGWPLPPSLS